MAPHFGRMQVQENIRRYHHDAVARRVLVAMAKDRLPNLVFDDIALDFIQKAHDLYPLNFQHAVGMLFIRLGSGTHFEEFAFIDNELPIIANSHLIAV